MRSMRWIVAVSMVCLLPSMAVAQPEKPSREPQAAIHTITLKPSEQGCAVMLKTKVGKALGTPEGLATPTQGDSGTESLPSIIACQCGPKTESKECPQGGTCDCRAPNDTPTVTCN